VRGDHQLFQKARADKAKWSQAFSQRVIESDGETLVVSGHRSQRLLENGTLISGVKDNMGEKEKMTPWFLFTLCSVYMFISLSMWSSVLLSRDKLLGDTMC
jgi:hypothetical protein